MFDKTFTRIPKTVFALQWLPHARLPNVTNIMGEIVQPGFNTTMGMPYSSNDPFQPPQKPKITCVGATVKIGEVEYSLEPHDYVIYSCDNNQPVQVLSEKMFSVMYVDSALFKLCDSCAELAKNINKPMENKAFADMARDYIELLRRGNVVSIPSANGNIDFKTEQEFREYCAKFGKII